MTDFELQLLQRIENLEDKVNQLQSGKSPVVETALRFDSLPPNTTVGKDYIAWRFGCSVDAVSKGRNGTDRIRFVSHKPKKALKSEVDRAFREYTKPVAQKVAENRAKAPIRKRSIIKRQVTSEKL